LVYIIKFFFIVKFQVIALFHNFLNRPFKARSFRHLENNKALLATQERLSFVGVAGFEPTTSCSQSRRDTGLRYTPKIGITFINSTKNPLVVIYLGMQR
jgi:hypothetical protein